jgi:hypothetical protein
MELWIYCGAYLRLVTSIVNIIHIESSAKNNAVCCVGNHPEASGRPGGSSL